MNNKNNSIAEFYYTYMIYGSFTALISSLLTVGYINFTHIESQTCCLIGLSCVIMGIYLAMISALSKNTTYKFTYAKIWLTISAFFAELALLIEISYVSMVITGVNIVFLAYFVLQ